MSYRAEIIGVGTGLPRTIMTNADFEKFIDTTDEWIRTRTGISQRHIADPKLGETTYSLSLEASKRALDMAGISGELLDMIVVGTVTPDTIMPSTGNSLQAALGAKNAFSFDLQAACSGFIYGLGVVDQFMRTGKVRHALVIGAETLSTMMNWQDRKTCVLFGDAAGAAVLRRTDDTTRGIIATSLYSDGNYANILTIPHGYTKVPTWSAEYSESMHKIRMEGTEVFKIAVRSMIESSQRILAENKLTTKDVDFFIFHQANIRIIDMCLKTLDIPREKTWINVEKYGNTSAATMPVCLDEAWKAGAVKKGDLILMSTFGGGLTWGSALVRL